jgi:hypothetical protein
VKWVFVNYHGQSEMAIMQSEKKVEWGSLLLLEKHRVAL